MTTPIWVRNLEWLETHDIREILEAMPQNLDALNASVGNLTAATTALTAAAGEAVTVIGAAATLEAGLNEQIATLTEELATPIDTTAIDAATAQVKTVTNQLLGAAQTDTTVVISPSAPSTVAAGGTQQFAAVANDQSGTALVTQPAFTWSLQAGAAGSIDQTGLYTASTVPGTGTDQVTATVTGTTIADTVAVQYA